MDEYYCRTCGEEWYGGDRAEMAYRNHICEPIAPAPPLSASEFERLLASIDKAYEIETDRLIAKRLAGR